MVGPPDVVQPWMPRAARDSDACLWYVSIVGGARRRGCAASGVPEFFNGPPRSRCRGRQRERQRLAVRAGTERVVGTDNLPEADRGHLVADRTAVGGDRRRAG